jgi:hypothetical protein
MNPKYSIFLLKIRCKNNPPSRGDGAKPEGFGVPSPACFLLARYFKNEKKATISTPNF